MLATFKFGDFPQIRQIKNLAKVPRYTVFYMAFMGLLINKGMVHKRGTVPLLLVNLNCLCTYFQCLILCSMCTLPLADTNSLLLQYLLRGGSSTLCSLYGKAGHKHAHKQTTGSPDKVFLQ